LARELIEELTVIDAKIRAADKRLRQFVTTTDSSLTELNGIGPSGAARLIGDIGDVSRFGTAAHFASWNGTAPIEASSGDQKRFRLSRAGNRRINRVLHIMAVTQIRHDTPGRAYYRRRQVEGKTRMEAMRALKRHLSDVVYRQMLRDARRAATKATVREDTWERLCNPARTAQSRRPPLRTSHSPDPPPQSLEHFWSQSLDP
jgi:transposase